MAHQPQGLQRRRLLHAGAMRGVAAGGRELLHAVAAEATQALLGALAQAAQELLQPRRRSTAALAARWPPRLPGWRGTMLIHHVPGMGNKTGSCHRAGGASCTRLHSLECCSTVKSGCTVRSGCSHLPAAVTQHVQGRLHEPKLPEGLPTRFPHNFRVLTPFRPPPLSA